MPLKTCRYGAMLNDSGGVVDDLIVYRKAAQEWMIVVNAANIEKDARHFRASLNARAHFEDVSFKTAKLDLQGPQSRDVLRPWGGYRKINLLYFRSISTIRHPLFDQPHRIYR